MDIKRYKGHSVRFMDDNVEYVKYADHLKALEENQPGYYESIVAIKLKGVDGRLDNHWEWLKKLSDRVLELELTCNGCECIQMFER